MNCKIRIMNAREKYTAIFLTLGIILALLPLSANRPLSAKPDKLLSELLTENSYFTVDQVARFIVSEDSTVQIIDLRSGDEYSKLNIPGSVNIPYDEIFNIDRSGLLNRKDIKTILYSNGDVVANYALVIAKGMTYTNIFTMKGGMNEWFNTIMNTSFTGERITARENALFETRTRAGSLFTEINSLPDSLKQKYRDDKLIAAKKLDGGCE